MFKASASLIPFEMRRRLIPLSAIVGAVVWASLLLLQPPLAVWILAFGPTVIVPLGLSLLERNSVPENEGRLLKLGSRLVVPTAALFVAGLWLEQSFAAASLAAAWLLTSLLLAMAGLMRLWRNGWCFNADTAAAAGLLFLPVGAGWAVLSRAGLRPHDFSHEIVLLTGVHFHYAGFALPLLMAAAMPQRLSRLHRGLIAAVVIGVPAVGVGISLSPLVEVGAAIVLALACLLLAALQTREALQSANANAAMLLLICSMSIAAAMVLAGTYAVGEFSEIGWLSIPAMVQSHGSLNAFGFALCGLLARVFGGASQPA